MTDLELLDQIDEKIELYNQAWAADLKRLYQKYGKIVDTPKWDKKVNKLTKKYSSVLADLTLERQDAIDRLSELGEQLFMAQFEPKKIPEEQEAGSTREQATSTTEKRDAARIAQIVQQAREQEQKID